MNSLINLLFPIHSNSSIHPLIHSLLISLKQSSIHSKIHSLIQSSFYLESLKTELPQESLTPIRRHSLSICFNIYASSVIYLSMYIFFYIYLIIFLSIYLSVPILFYLNNSYSFFFFPHTKTVKNMTLLISFVYLECLAVDS